MVTLTSARVSRPGQISLLHVPNLPDVPAPATPRRPVCLSLRFDIRAGPRAESRAFCRHACALYGTLGFASLSQARRSDRPNRVHFRSGPPVRLPVLSTPSRDDAVPVGYRIKLKPPDRDSHPADSVHSQTHEYGDLSPLFVSMGRGIQRTGRFFENCEFRELDSSDKSEHVKAHRDEGQASSGAAAIRSPSVGSTCSRIRSRSSSTDSQRSFLSEL